MNRTDRLYAVVEELRAAGDLGHQAASLAARFEVSVRTIKRDISALQQAGVPIWAASGPRGGYVLDSRSALPPVAFTPGEALAVAVALSAQSDQPFRPEGRSALTKLLGAMHTDARQRAEVAASRLLLPRPAAPLPGSSVGRVVTTAVVDGVVLSLDYVDRHGRSTTKRRVEPLALTLHKGTWYLLAWCHDRGAGRSFRLDRITGAWPTTKRFTPRRLEAVFDELPGGAEAIGLS